MVSSDDARTLGRYLDQRDGVPVEMGMMCSHRGPYRPLGPGRRSHLSVHQHHAVGEVALSGKSVEPNSTGPGSPPKRLSRAAVSPVNGSAAARQLRPVPPPPMSSA